MKTRRLLFGTAVILLLMVGASAQRNNPRGGHPMMGGHNGFERAGDHMNVVGNISTSDDGVTISLSVTPTQEALERRPDLPADFSNQVNVTLYSLVEFEDNNSNGYDAGDMVISTYELNTNTLNALERSTSGDLELYTITSVDGIFKLTLEVNTTETSVIQWKWSVDISYSFTSTTSEIAMLHEVSATMGMAHMKRAQPMHPPAHAERLNNQTMSYNNGHVPMFFRWISTAEVDGQEMNITATAADSFFAISIPQGDSIYYDPSVGVDIQTIENAEEILADEIGDGNTLGEDLPLQGVAFLSSLTLLAGALALRRRKAEF